jgi:hypothetical protein
MAAHRAEALLRVLVALKCQLPRRVGPGLSVRSVELTLQVSKFRMHQTDCILDPGIETTGLLASALCAIAYPFEIIDTLPDPILILGRNDLLCRFAFLIKFVHPVHQISWDRLVSMACP